MRKLETNKASKRKETLFVRITLTNKTFAMREARRLGHKSLSEYMDSLLNARRMWAKTQVTHY